VEGLSLANGKEHHARLAMSEKLGVRSFDDLRAAG
jgi:hypothetical protein